MLREIKRTIGCERCGERDPACLQFHHPDGATKEFALGMPDWVRSLARTLAEARKCRVLCANCHLKLHWEERRLERDALV